GSAGGNAKEGGNDAAQADEPAQSWREAEFETHGDGRRRLYDPALSPDGRGYCGLFGAAARTRRPRPAAAGKQTGLGESGEDAGRNHQGRFSRSANEGSGRTQEMGGAGRWQRNAAGNPPQAVPQTRLLSM